MHGKRKHLRVWSAPVIGLLSVAVASSGRAPEKPLAKLKIAYSSVSGNMAPLWIAHERGFFRKYGLEIEPVFIESGSTTAKALAGGDVAFAQMAGPAAVQSRLRGSDVVMIAGIINTLTFKFYVDSRIKYPEQLRGKSVAVTRFGSSTDFAARLALARYGLAPEKDVTMVQAGSMPAVLASLESGKAHGAMLSAPFALRAKKMGFRLLADLQRLGLEYQHTGLATTRTLIESRPEVARNVIRAYVEAIHFYKNHRAESLKVLAKYLKTAEREALAEIYQDIGLALTPEKPYPTVRGIEVILRELALEDPKARSARAEEFVDLAFVEELDRSGFVDRLYRTPVTASRGAGRAGPASAGQPFEYTVQEGDTLSALALRYYGDMFEWPRIYEANREAIKHPDSIYAGQRLLIPP